MKCKRRIRVKDQKSKGLRRKTTKGAKDQRCKGSEIRRIRDSKYQGFKGSEDQRIRRFKGAEDSKEQFCDM